MFEAFYRSGADAARSTNGAGLGLAVARAIVDAHGGQIWLPATHSRHARALQRSDRRVAPAHAPSARAVYAERRKSTALRSVRDPAKSSGAATRCLQEGELARDLCDAVAGDVVKHPGLDRDPAVVGLVEAQRARLLRVVDQ